MKVSAAEGKALSQLDRTNLPQERICLVENEYKQCVGCQRFFGQIQRAIWCNTHYAWAACAACHLLLIKNCCYGRQ